MADEAVEHITIAAAPGRCFEVAVDFENYPRWATDVKEAEVLDRDADGRGAKVRYGVTAMGQTIGYVLDYHYAGAPTEFSWTLAESKVLTRPRRHLPLRPRSRRRRRRDRADLPAGGRSQPSAARLHEAAGGADGRFRTR